jgi:Tfp pilus assembly protein PilF
MSKRRVGCAHRWAVVWPSICLCIATGCAGWKQKVQKPNLSNNREDRATDAVRSFEERRDAAQLGAALDRWKQGDIATAEASLAAIIRRRPDCNDARMRLAEILWSHNDASAEPHLRAVLQTEPNRAEAHHALGLLLDGTGRAEEARHHLSKAAELEPENEIYRTTCESLALLQAPLALTQ